MMGDQKKKGSLGTEKKRQRSRKSRGGKKVFNMERGLRAVVAWSWQNRSASVSPDDVVSSPGEPTSQKPTLASMCATQRGS